MNRAEPAPPPEVSFVMPCYNEQSVIRLTIPQLANAFEKAGYALELVAVDNGSSDRTGEIIQQLAARYPCIVPLRIERNEGYGNGVISAIRVCRAPYIGFIPADGPIDAVEVVRLFELAQMSGGNVITKVRRRFRTDGIRRRFVSIVYNFLFRLLWPGLPSSDVNAQPKILPADLLRSLDLRSKGWFLDPELMIKSHYMGVQVRELNVFDRSRSGGSSHVDLGTYWSFVWQLLYFRFSREGLAWRRSFASASDRAHQET